MTRARDLADGKFVSLDISGDIDVDGTTNLDAVDIDSAVDINGVVHVSPNTAGKDTFELSTNAVDEGRLRIKNVDTTTVQIRAGGDSYFNGGDVGIGEDNPATTVHVTASAPAFTLNTAASMTSGNRADINVYNSDRSGVGLIRFGAETDNVGTNMQFYTRPASGSLAERMRILSGGNIDISAGHILLDNGYGINFAATSDASGMTSEILDDYEEGTWTASVVGSSGGTAQTMSGYYTKVGNIVYAHASAVSGLNLSSSSGVLVINGLPFTAKSGPYQAFHLAHNNAGTNASDRPQLIGYVAGNTQIVALVIGSGVGWNDFTIGSSTSAGIIVSGTYEVA